jgi:tripartite-type tricarboxylate transporter receptor subunit TctC
MLKQVACALVFFWISLVCTVHAEKVMKVIVPFAPGGPVDMTTRWLMQEAQEPLGLSIVVENRPGAGGNIGMQAIAKAAPDGMTLGIATTASNALNPWLFTKLPYQAQSDFQAITQMLSVPNILVIQSEHAARLGIRTLPDLIQYAKLHPGKMNYGSGGNGSAGHLSAEWIKSIAQLDITHIPFNGAQPAQMALLSGQVDFNIDNLASAAMNIKSGKLMALAITSAQRSPLMPQIPSVAETLPHFEIETWWGLVSPKGVNPEWVEKLNVELVKILKSPAIRTKFATLMAEPQPSSPEQFERMMAAQREKYKHLVQISGATVD